MWFYKRLNPAGRVKWKTWKVSRRPHLSPTPHPKASQSQLGSSPDWSYKVHFLNAVYFLPMCIYVSLHVRLCAKCMQYVWRSEGGVRFPGTGVPAGVLFCHQMWACRTKPGPSAWAECTWNCWVISPAPTEHISRPLRRAQIDYGFGQPSWCSIVILKVMPNYKTIPLSAPPLAAGRTWHTTMPVVYHKTFLSLAKLAFLSLRSIEAGKLRERRASSPGGHPGMRESQTNPLGFGFPSKFLFHFSPGNFLPLPHPPTVSCQFHHHLVILHTSCS